MTKPSKVTTRDNSLNKKEMEEIVKEKDKREAEKEKKEGGEEKMNSEKKTVTILEDAKINIKMKLSGLWVTVMFLFAYVDIMGKYQPGHIEDIMAGEVAGFQITQVWILGVIIIMTTAILMVFLSLTLKPKANRWVNIIVGIFHIVFVISSLFIGESWAYYIFGSIVEVVLLSLIVWYAWKWPKQEG
ncbi:MAG: hypothetical protein E3J56_02990 [Candidatus Aminicenantes bacterium]|nr:MAG: hypothetical protein E3J56_02990 [Candidatus Aminicenantes bacterium]